MLEKLVLVYYIDNFICLSIDNTDVKEQSNSNLPNPHQAANKDLLVNEG